MRTASMRQVPGNALRISLAKFVQFTVPGPIWEAEVTENRTRWQC
jgi:hypothetical protein